MPYAVRIKKVGDDLYVARVLDIDGPIIESAWTSLEPQGGDQLIGVLLKLGIHQIDIGDAFVDADPEWIKSQLGGAEFPPRRQP